MAELKKPRPKTSGRKKIEDIRVVKKVKKTLGKKSKVVGMEIRLKSGRVPKKNKKVSPKERGEKKDKKNPEIIKKHEGNPIMGPSHHESWESEAVFNPGAVVHDGRVHLFYRALGPDGVSRIGYTSSRDGINFDDRLSYPVFVAESFNEAKSHHPYTSPARLVYNPSVYASGGGWGGCEDPRAVKIGNRIYMTFNMFNGWHSMRVAVTSISEEDLNHKRWNWAPYHYLSKLGDRQKNWVLFPQKINGKFALFHNLDMGDKGKVHIAYVNKLDASETPKDKEAPDPQGLPDHIVAWHNRTRSASAPPIKTKEGWLLFYHAMDKDDPNRYKVGAMLLDLKDPTKVLYRSAYPVLEPDEWYENDYKPGIVYASGAVVKDGTLFMYYGGGDKHIAVAYARLDDFLKKLKNKEHAVLSKKSVLEV